MSSILVMTSPESIPALMAGESSIGVTTTTCPSSMVISMPDALELAGGHLLELLEGLLVEEAREGVVQAN